MIRKHVDAFQPDVIQLNGSLFGLAGRILPTPGRAKFFTYHGLPFGDGRGFAKNAFLLGVEIFAANWSRGHHIFISKRDMKTLRRFKIGKNRLHYVPNGISLPKAGAGPASDKHPGQTNLVTVANNMPAKRLDRLIGAFALLDDSFTLTLVGDDTDGAQIGALAEALLTAGQRERLRLMGRRPDVGKFLRDGDIFVLSSDYEGMPMSALEALSQGLLVVMPDVGGAEEICAEGAGLVYAPNTEAQLAASLREASKLIQAPDWSPGLPKAHHERHFTSERMLEAMEALYYGAEKAGEED
jgi:glycosyltransferase involved in cell wall biosynthesis